MQKTVLVLLGLEMFLQWNLKNRFLILYTAAVLSTDSAPSLLVYKSDIDQQLFVKLV